MAAGTAGEGTLLRIEIRLAGDDPRVSLRERLPDPAELEEICGRLARFDAAGGTPWTTRYPQLIGDRPPRGVATLDHLVRTQG